MSDSTAPVAAPARGAGPRSDGPRPVGELAEGLIRDFHPATALDVGGGSNGLVEALRERGVAATGIDAPPSGPSEARYDLATCLGSLEGASPEAFDAVVACLCAASDTIVVAGGPEPHEWAAVLAERGFAHSLDRDLSYIAPGAAAFVRAEESRVETVRRYERAWWRLREELAEVRRALSAQRQRLAELEGEVGAEGRAELVERVERSEAEVLRLRDLLIGKEAELGVAVGRVAEHEARGSWKAILKDRWHRFRGAVAEVPGARRLKRMIRSR